MIRRLILTVGCLMVVAATTWLVAPGSADEPAGFNRLVDPDAANGVTGWLDNGFVAVQYGSSATVPPASFAAGLQTGPWLFQATETGATMTQTADMSDVASTIDAGNQELGVTALLGGAGSSDDGVALTAQPEDANGQPLGSPMVLGPATAADRDDQATMVACVAVVKAPVGTRLVRVMLTATGTPGQPSTGTAGYVDLAAPLIGTTGGNTTGPAQGQNCHVIAPSTLSGPDVGAPTTAGTTPVITTPAPPLSTPTPTTITTATPPHVTVAPATVRAALRRIVTTRVVNVVGVEHAHGYDISAAVPVAGRLQLELFAASDGTRRLVGRATHNYPKAEKASVKLTLNRAGLKLLMDNKKNLKLSERASFTPLHAQKITLTSAIRVRS